EIDVEAAQHALIIGEGEARIVGRDAAAQDAARLDVLERPGFGGERRAEQQRRGKGDGVAHVSPPLSCLTFGVVRRSHPLTLGSWMNGHGLGIGPHGTSIRTGTSAAKAASSARRSASGEAARTPLTPKLSARRTKSGLVRSLPMTRLP